MDQDNIESIFAYAVAMDQAGKMKNTILCHKRKIFIVNFDKTIILNFVLPKTCQEFKEKIVFDANDYDSSIFSIDGDSIVFKQVQDGYVRKKRCGVNKSLDYDDVSSLFYGYFGKETTSTFVLRKEIMALLQDDLSHVEFHYDNGLKVIQRDIFSGTIIEVERDKSGLDLLNQDKLEKFDPIGIRMVDLDVLFSSDRELSFSFVPGMNYFVLEGKTTKMKGLLSWCLYDEIGRLGIVGG